MRCITNQQAQYVAGQQSPPRVVLPVCVAALACLHATRSPATMPGQIPGYWPAPYPDIYQLSLILGLHVVPHKPANRPVPFSGVPRNRLPDLLLAHGRSPHPRPPSPLPTDPPWLLIAMPVGRPISILAWPAGPPAPPAMPPTDCHHQGPDGSSQHALKIPYPDPTSEMRNSVWRPGDLPPDAPLVLIIMRSIVVPATNVAPAPPVSWPPLPRLPTPP